MCHIYNGLAPSYEFNVRRNNENKKLDVDTVNYFKYFPPFSGLITERQRLKIKFTCWSKNCSVDLKSTAPSIGKSPEEKLTCS